MGHITGGRGTVCASVFGSTLSKMETDHYHQHSVMNLPSPPKQNMIVSATSPAQKPRSGVPVLTDPARHIKLVTEVPRTN
jgi:hypothetical protein